MTEIGFNFHLLFESCFYLLRWWKFHVHAFLDLFMPQDWEGKSSADVFCEVTFVCQKGEGLSDLQFNSQSS